MDQTLKLPHFFDRSWQKLPSAATYRLALINLIRLRLGGMQKLMAHWKLSRYRRCSGDSVVISCGLIPRDSEATTAWAEAILFSHFARDKAKHYGWRWFEKILLFDAIGSWGYIHWMVRQAGFVEFEVIQHFSPGFQCFRAWLESAAPFPSP